VSHSNASSGSGSAPVLPSFSQSIFSRFARISFTWTATWLVHRQPQWRQSTSALEFSEFAENAGT